LSTINTSYFHLDQPNVIIDTIKRVEDITPGKTELILRAFEAYGGRCTAQIET